MRILGIDYGDARIGLALSDPTGFLASPLDILKERNMDRASEHIAHIVYDKSVERVVLGYPRNTNNTLGERANKTLLFKEVLEKKLGSSIPVILWDERFSTKSAIDILNTTNTRGKKRKEVLDSVAAVLILQSYIDSL